jgi:hypothetical protein
MTYSVGMSKQKLTLYADTKVIEQMKIQAVREKQSLSVITENLYREYLKGKASKKNEKS